MANKNEKQPEMREYSDAPRPKILCNIANENDEQPEMRQYSEVPRSQTLRNTANENKNMPEMRQYSDFFKDSNAAADSQVKPNEPMDQHNGVELKNVSRAEQKTLWVDEQMTAAENKEHANAALEREIQFRKKENADLKKRLGQRSFNNHRDMNKLVSDNTKLVEQLTSARGNAMRYKKELNETLEKLGSGKVQYENETRRLTEIIFKSDQHAADQMRALEKELKELQDKVFQLQPYAQEITASTAVELYTALCRGVEKWVEDALSPILDEEQRFQSTCKAVERNPELFVPFQKELRNTDSIAITYQNADTHLVVAIIMRILQRDLWEQHLFGEDDAATLKVMEKAMGDLQPKRDVATIRSWRNETYRALSQTLSHQEWKGKKASELALRMADIFKFFTFEESPDSVIASIRSRIIEPAIILNEQLALDPKLYYLKECLRIESADDPSAMLVEQMDCLDCKNILKGGKQFGRANLGAGSIQYLCTTTPALTCCEIQGDIVLEERILRKPQVIVAPRSDALSGSKDCVPGLIASLNGIKSQQGGWNGNWLPPLGGIGSWAQSFGAPHWLI